MRPLVWLRADLRLSDNRALAAASSSADDGLVAVFCICKRQWASHDTSGVRVAFVLEHLRVLSESLAERNIPLRILEHDTFDDTPAALLGLANTLGCDALYFNDEYELNERERDERVVETFQHAGKPAHRFTDQVLFTPGEVRTGQGGYYSVFTPFKRACYKLLDRDRSPLEESRAPCKQRRIDVEPSAVPGSVEGFENHVDVDVMSSWWPAGEDAARDRLERFCAERISEYNDRRDTPGEPATSMLSPYLAVGSVSLRQCMNRALGCNSGAFEHKQRPGATNWITELVWREFYKHILVGFPRVCRHRAFRPETERIEWSDNEEHFRAWCEGRTGVPIVDAGMRQLQRVGWVHNRVRMICAMFLTKDLFIDWRRGERFYMQHLIDGDLASNNGGWQWSASTGTDAAPYFRVFNPYAQSRKADPDGAYIREYVPELGDLTGGEKGEIHEPGALPERSRSALDYPDPIVDRTKTRDRVVEAFKAIKE